MTTLREQAKDYISYYMDDSLAVHDQPFEITDKVRLVGWQCGFEPLFVAVRSYLDVSLDDDEAEDIAKDYLTEIGWFADEPTSADYIL